MTAEQTKPEAEEAGGYLSVVSKMKTDGGFECVLMLDDKQLLVLDVERALAYVNELSWVVTCAYYDAAVFAQLAEAEIPLPWIAAVMKGLRGERREPVVAATHPLTFNGIVSMRDKQPRITATAGDVSWQWELDDARQHINQVLEVATGVEMDVLYLKYLMEEVGLPERNAREMIYRLREHMPGCVDPDAWPPAAG